MRSRVTAILVPMGRGMFKVTGTGVRHIWPKEGEIITASMAEWLRLKRKWSLRIRQEGD